MTAGVSAYPDNLDLLIEEARRSLDAQSAELDALDRKAGSALFSASVLAILSGIVPAVSAGPQNDPARLWVFLALIGYEAILVAAYKAYTPGTYSRVSDPAELRKNYLSRPRAETQQKLLDASCTAHSDNAKRIEQKAKWTTRSLQLLIVEGILLVIILGAVALK